MDQDALNMQIRKFLKQVGVTSQREIESAVQEALANGRLSDSATLTASMLLEIPDLGLRHRVEGKISLR